MTNKSIKTVEAHPTRDAHKLIVMLLNDLVLGEGNGYIMGMAIGARAQAIQL